MVGYYRPNTPRRERLFRTGSPRDPYNGCSRWSGRVCFVRASAGGVSVSYGLRGGASVSYGLPHTRPHSSWFNFPPGGDTGRVCFVRAPGIWSVGHCHKPHISWGESWSASSPRAPPSGTNLGSVLVIGSERALAARSKFGGARLAVARGFMHVPECKLWVRARRQEACS